MIVEWTDHCIFAGANGVGSDITGAPSPCEGNTGDGDCSVYSTNVMGKHSVARAKNKLVFVGCVRGGHRQICCVGAVGPKLTWRPFLCQSYSRHIPSPYS